MSDFLISIGLSVLVAFIALFLGLIYKGIDRKLVARLQSRIGPPLIQPFRDFAKLMMKKNVIPEDAVSWVYNGVPIVSLAATLTIILYIPFMGIAPILDGYGDLILILYLLMIPSLCMVIGGFSSGSPYASVGAQREMVMMMSYEFPLSVVIISFAVLTGSFELSAMSSLSVWALVGPLGLIGLFMLLGIMIVITPAELSKIPFDAPEAETEIGGGLFVEYSGRNLALFYLADAVKTIVMASLIIALFFPHTVNDVFGLSLAAESMELYLANFLFFLLKVFIVMLVSVTVIRAGFARLQIDKIARLYMVPATLLALVGLGLIMLDMGIGV